MFVKTIHAHKNRMIELRQVWSLHLSSYLCNGGRLTSSWPTSRDEHNWTAERKGIKYLVGLMFILTLCAKFSNSLRNWEVIIPTDRSTALVVQAHLFVCSGLQFLKKQTNSHKRCLLVLRPGCGKAACVKGGGSHQQSLPSRWVGYWFTGFHSLVFRKQAFPNKTILNYLHVLATFWAYLYFVNVVAYPWDFWLK